jgi:very-short-patch-repair endonuclease
MSYQKTFQNKPNYIDRRKHLRNIPTKAEYVLWQELRRQRLGYLFRRQFQIGPYIADFYCNELRLVVEVDGPIHAEQIVYDRRRDEYMRRHGCTVFRCSNDGVLFYRDRIVDDIRRLCGTIVVSRG